MGVKKDERDEREARVGTLCPFAAVCGFRGHPRTAIPAAASTASNTPGGSHLLAAPLVHERRLAVGLPGSRQHDVAQSRAGCVQVVDQPHVLERGLYTRTPYGLAHLQRGNASACARTFARCPYPACVRLHAPCAAVALRYSCRGARAHATPRARSAGECTRP